MSMTCPNFITHYFTSEHGPFSNILEAIERDPGLVGRINERSAIIHARFLHPLYLPCRVETERRLREVFQAKGGKVTDAHPVYFTLGDSSFLESKTDHRYRRKVRIPISVLETECMSFTYVDSMTMIHLRANRESAPTIRPHYEDVYTHEEFQDVIRKLGYYDDRWVTDSTIHFDTYIEVQYWNRGHLTDDRQRYFVWT